MSQAIQQNNINAVIDALQNCINLLKQLQVSEKKVTVKFADATEYYSDNTFAYKLFTKSSVNLDAPKDVIHDILSATTDEIVVSNLAAIKFIIDDLNDLDDMVDLCSEYTYSTLREAAMKYIESTSFNFIVFINDMHCDVTLMMRDILEGLSTKPLTQGDFELFELVVKTKDKDLTKVLSKKARAYLSKKMLKELDSVF